MPALASAAGNFSSNSATDYALTSGATTFTNKAGTPATLDAASLPPIVKGDVRVGLVSVASGLVAPIDLVAANDESGRLFVVDQPGQVRIIKNGKLLATPLLDVSSRLVTLDSGYDERGLLGLALHPGFNNPSSVGYRKLYTYTSEPVTGTADFPATMTGTPDHQSVITEWQVLANNPDSVDLTSRREVVRIDKPQSNHNAGKLAFRPSDGYLYISLGDGGQADDVGDGHTPTTGNAQDTTKILGKILRIDPIAPASTPGSSDATSANGKYRVPASNPFASSGGVKEIFALGLRNPFRFSFDTGSGADRLVVADVGQDHTEEVDLVEKGKNYGWHLKEGSFLFDPSTGNDSVDTNPDPSLIDPVLEYSHNDGSAVIGGYVYHGTAISDLSGKYIFGDFASGSAGRLFYGDLSTGNILEMNIGLGNDSLGRFIKGFGQDENGELYVLGSTSVGPSGQTGEVLKIVPLSMSVRAIGDVVTGQAAETYAAFAAAQTGANEGSFSANHKKVSALFAADGSVLLALGDPAPGISGTAISKFGAVSGDAALATLKVGSGGITSKTDLALVAGLSSGIPRVAAQSGITQTGLPTGVTIKSFGPFDGNGADIFFLATLQGTGVTAKNAATLCVALGDGSVKVLAQVGDSVGGKTIATIGTLVGSKGSLAEGRWRADDTTLGVRLTFAAPAKGQAIYTIPATAASSADWTLVLATGPATPIASISTTTIASFGLPGFGPQSCAVLANLATSPGNVTASNNQVLIAGPIGGALKVVQRKGDQINTDADGHSLSSVSLKTMSDPVVGSSGKVSYMVTATGNGFASGIEYAADGATPVVLANVGSAAAGGGHWASFTSLALPDGAASGPLLTAKLAISAADGVTAKNNSGFWGIDSTGNLELLLRTNQQVAVGSSTRTLKTFTALVPVTGTAGTAVGYDNSGNIAVIATFTDGSQALLKLAVP